jgi:hypothetical protein
MKLRRRFACYAIVMLLAGLAAAPAETMPRLDGETLSDKPVVLPDVARGKVALLSIGFSRSGGDESRAWSQRFQKDFGTDSNYAVYPVAVLEDAPRLVRGMIRSGMKRDLAPSARDNFVILVHGSAELKRFVEFSADADAYLVLLDRKGEVRWRGHGALQEDTYGTLRDAARKLSSQ